MNKTAPHISQSPAMLPVARLDGTTTRMNKPSPIAASTAPQSVMVEGVPVETFRSELEGGQYNLTRDFFAKLRLNPSNDETRSVCMDRLAQCYRYRHHTQEPQAGSEAAPTISPPPSPPLSTLEKWTWNEPDNKDAHLLLGLFLITSAWSALRNHQSSTQQTAMTEEEHFAQFDKLAHKAERALAKAMEIDPTDPLPYANMLTAARGLPTIQATFQKFQQHCQDPHHLMVHQVVLHRLSPHWGGTVAEMLEFARSVTLQSDVPPPTGHPLWSLLCKAHLDAWEEAKKQREEDGTNNSKGQGHGHDSYWKHLKSKSKKELVHAYRKFRGKSHSSHGTACKASGSKNAINTGNTKQGSKEERSSSNLFAFCLYKIKAYSEVHDEMQYMIGNDPLAEPWNLESPLHWKGYYDHAKKKVAEHEASTGTNNQNKHRRKSVPAIPTTARGTGRCQLERKSVTLLFSPTVLSSGEFTLSDITSPSSSSGTGSDHKDREIVDPFA
ncbi:expressed unknown protein [Seminavis robusta]|uniref:Uncharacterized protein n=1 Tax=Seminavis robusta TaxID=568900 RepID=A0A9N8D489_9STRA|nr:expressed unknown protein [Seminavis robusta]|eukprot:Sro1_g000910.1 n/a (497) ;mRNA; f:272274-273764